MAEEFKPKKRRSLDETIKDFVHKKHDPELPKAHDVITPYGHLDEPEAKPFDEGTDPEVVTKPTVVPESEPELPKGPAAFVTPPAAYQGPATVATVTTPVAPKVWRYQGEETDNDRCNDCGQIKDKACDGNHTVVKFSQQVVLNLVVYPVGIPCMVLTALVPTWLAAGVCSVPSKE